MKGLLRLGCFLLMLFAASSPALADHSVGSEQASAAYNTGDYQKAFGLWLAEANSGNPEAQEMLGAMYASGKGVARNDREAFRWYLLAAEQGVPSAQYSLGKMYALGRGVEQSPEHACAWWLVASAHGNVAAKRERKALHMTMTEEQTKKTYAIVIEILLKLGE